MKSSEPCSNRILIVDDNPAIHEDIRKILEPQSEASAEFDQAKASLFDEAQQPAARVAFEIDSAFQGEEALSKVEAAVAEGRPYAMAFIDVRMPPGWDGVETINRIWERYPELQVVICTAYSDYSWEEMVRRIGRSDKLLILKKPFETTEVLQLAHALTEKWLLTRKVKSQIEQLDQLVNQRTSELQQANEQLKREIAERLQVEKALRLSEERFSKAFKASPVPLAIQSLREEKFVDANLGFLSVTGYAREELLGHTPEELGLWQDAGARNLVLQQLRMEMSVRNLPCRFRNKSGRVLDILLSVELFELDNEPFLLTIAQDMTELVQLEGQLRQSQKLEAVGQLAAGVAHDFNNILTVVQGNASLLLTTQWPPATQRKHLQTICAAAERATRLVRQLLTFSRKQFVQKRPLNLAELLRNTIDLLPRLLGESVLVKSQIRPQSPLVNADAELMEQVFLNLAVNARDAMPKGGSLTFFVETATVTPQTARRNAEAYPGEFLCVSVVDTGSGISPEALPHLFEPFFTTKPVGQGSGLGLATVYGIVRQHQGWIEVQSAVGQGSTFKVFLPVFQAAAGQEPHPTAVQGGSETVLVVEDEEDVRDFVVELLGSYGYTVLQAVSGPDALAKWPQYRSQTRLVLTDIIMPGGLTGRQLAEQLLADTPGLKVLFTSGYSPGMAGNELSGLDQRNFLPKPYNPDALLRMIRNSLDG